MFGYGVVELLTLILGVFCIIQLDKVNDISTEISIKHLPATFDVSDLNTKTADFRVAELQHILSNTPEEQYGFEVHLDGYLHTIQKRLADYQTLIGSPAEAVLYQKFMDDWEIYLQEHRRIRELSRNDRKKEALKAIRGESQRAYDAHSATLNELVRLKLEDGRLTSERGDSIYHTSLVMAIALLIIILATSMVFAALIERERSRLQAQTIHSARLASLGELSASIAHEINNPNNAIGFNIGVLERIWADAILLMHDANSELGELKLGGLPGERALTQFSELLDSIRNNSNRIKAIVGNLKQMARHDSGKLTERVNISTIINSALIILNNQITKHTDHLTADIPPDLPDVLGNAQQLEQVFINVVHNALQSLPARDRGVHVAIRHEQSQGVVMITVRDQGIGMTRSDLVRVTEPFFTTRSGEEGIGLGLSIANTIVHDHHGTMTFSSELHEGTLVSIALPVHTPTA